MSILETNKSLMYCLGVSFKFIPNGNGFLLSCPCDTAGLSGCQTGIKHKATNINVLKTISCKERGP